MENLRHQNQAICHKKYFDNDLVAIRKSKVKAAYVRMCILDLSKVLLHKFHYDYIKNKYSNNSRLLFTDTDSLLYEIKARDVCENLVRMKKCLILVIFQLSQNIMMIQTN